MENHSKFVGIRSISSYTTYHNNSVELRYLVIALDAQDEHGNRLFLRLSPERTRALQSTITRALEGRSTHDSHLQAARV